MSEGEYIDWELLFSPRKKKSKKKVKSSSFKVLTQTPKEDKPKKKKKNAKFKKHMADWKEKRKEKKKKQKSSKPHNDSFVNDCEDKTECIEHLPSEYTTQGSKKKKKKRVVFDIPHNSEKIKRPKFSSSPQEPADSPFPINTVKEGTAGVEPSHVQTKTSDSQSTSDDMQSQDLFITQKTFRLPLSEMSNDETSDRAEDSTKAQGFYVRETQEECVLFKTQNIKKSPLYQEKVKRSPSNPFLEEPIVVTSSPDGEKATRNCTEFNPLSHSDQQQKCLTSVCTQTENFFSTELSLYLDFCKKSKSKTQSDELVPLDLSLPRGARRGVGTSNIAKHEETCLDIIEIDDEGSTQLDLCGQGKQERKLSPESESDNKSADTTVSSEDAEVPSRTTRLGIMQVRAVQMRLNESFFFKTKGEGPSPRPESPLMKLVQGRELKSNKN